MLNKTANGVFVGDLTVFNFDGDAQAFEVREVLADGIDRDPPALWRPYTSALIGACSTSTSSQRASSSSATIIGNAVLMPWPISGLFETMRAYYKGDQRVELTDRAREYLESNGDINFAENFCEPIVDEIAFAGAELFDETKDIMDRTIDAARARIDSSNAGIVEGDQLLRGYLVQTMLDVALRGRGRDFNDVVIPGFEFFVVEDTLGKFGDRVENLTGWYDHSSSENAAPAKLPINVQSLVGNLD